MSFIKQMSYVFFPCFSTMTKWGDPKKIKRECSRRGSKASSKTNAFCKSYIKRDGYSQNHYLTILKMDFGNYIGIFFITFRRLIALCAYIDISISCFLGGGLDTCTIIPYNYANAIGYQPCILTNSHTHVLRDDPQDRWISAIVIREMAWAKIILNRWSFCWQIWLIVAKSGRVRERKVDWDF